MHEKMWKKLRNEMLHLVIKQVHSIDPLIVIEYMEFIREVMEKSKKLADWERWSPTAGPEDPLPGEDKS